MGSLYEGSKTETRALSALINLVRSAESVMGRLKGQFAGLAITQSQFSALDALIHLGPLSQRELGEKLFKTNELTQARKMLIEGLDRMDDVLGRYDDLISEDLTVEEALWALLLVKKIDELLEQPPADDLPLSGLWNRHLKDKVPTLQFDFNRRFGGL